MVRDLYTGYLTREETYSPSKGLPKGQNVYSQSPIYSPRNVKPCSHRLPSPSQIRAFGLYVLTPAQISYKYRIVQNKIERNVQGVMQNIIGMSGSPTPIFNPPQICSLNIPIFVLKGRIRVFVYRLKFWRLAFVVLSQLIMNMAMSYLS